MVGNVKFGYLLANKAVKEGYERDSPGTGGKIVE
jgi:hypothetical protein